MAMAMAGGAAGCQACAERAGIEVIDAKELEPLPHGPLGPRGLPRWTPLAPPRRDVTDQVESCLVQAIDRERDAPAYTAEYRGIGSAKHLRGKVAVLEIRLASAAAEAWTGADVRRASEDASAARSFVLSEAARYGIHDLAIEIFPWTVETELPQVKVQTDELGRPLDDAAVDVAYAHVKRATGVSIPQAVASLKQDGWSEVAVMLRLPTREIRREYAEPAREDGIDIAVVQLGQQPGTYAHELLHLFGAADLYRIASVDPRDDDDVMGGACGGRAWTRSRIGDATAWAVGWRAKPPDRTYAFGDQGGGRP